MRIGIDTFSFDKPGENLGVGPSVYVWSMLSELLKNEKYEFVIFTNKDNISMIPKTPNIEIVVSKFNNRFRPLRILHEQIELVFLANKHKVDVIHFLGNNVSYLLANKSVLTVHDLMWKYYFDLPDYRTLKNRYFALTVPRSLKRARAIISVSNFTKTQISNLFGVKRDKIVTIYEASGGIVKISAEKADIFKAKHNYRFIYSVTTSWPHKNLKRLIKAFIDIKKQNLYDGKLVVSGQLKGKEHIATSKLISDNGMQNDILLTGFVSEEEKSYCYLNSEIFVYPSLYEGFGLPVLEAMEAGVPVIASSAASIPEVGGDACLYFDPTSTDQLVDCLLRLIKSKEERNLYSRKGLVRQGNFSWKKTANETLAVYEKIR